MYDTKRWVLHLEIWNLKFYRSSNQERSDMTYLLMSLLSSTPQPKGTKEQAALRRTHRSCGTTARAFSKWRPGMPYHTGLHCVLPSTSTSPVPALATLPRARTAVEKKTPPHLRTFTTNFKDARRGNSCNLWEPSY
jgi:hypothetical protein